MVPVVEVLPSNTKVPAVQDGAGVGVGAGVALGVGVGVCAALASVLVLVPSLGILRSTC